MGRIRPFEERQRRGVTFKYPTGLIRKLKLVDEVMLSPEEMPDWPSPDGDYCDVIQLLEDEAGEQRIRFTYYRRPPGGDESSWVFAGQTSLTEPCSIWVRLFAKAMQKGWFKSLVREAEGVS